MARQNIRSLQANEDIFSPFLLGAASLQQSRNGPYWRLELRDATGTVEAKIWSPLSTSFSDLAAGQMVEVRAKAGLFRDQLQLTIEALRVLSDAEIALLDMGDFMLSSPRPASAMLADVKALCRSELSHKPWLQFALSVLDHPDIQARLLLAPAAKSVHHAYVSGLLEHMLSVAQLCMHMADHYTELDRQVLLTAALFHDIGKLEEMSGGMVNDYTDAGRFLGHIVQGLIMLEPHLLQSGLEADLALHFRHLIASHHGTLEFGSPREPATAEAFVLHYADNVDAKLAQLRGLFPVAQADDDQSPSRADRAAPQSSPAMQWSPWQNLLKRSLCRAVPTSQCMTNASSDLPHEEDKQNPEQKSEPHTADANTADPAGDHAEASAEAPPEASAEVPAEVPADDLSGPAKPATVIKKRQCSLL